MTPCLADACLISTKNRTLPAVPFSAAVVWAAGAAGHNDEGACACTPPLRCGEDGGGHAALRCGAVLARRCEGTRWVSRGNCFDCVDGHQPELGAAQCTPAEIHAFC